MRKKSPRLRLGISVGLQPHEKANKYKRLEPRAVLHRSRRNNPVNAYDPVPLTTTLTVRARIRRSISSVQFSTYAVSSEI